MTVHVGQSYLPGAEAAGRPGVIESRAHRAAKNCPGAIDTLIVPADGMKFESQSYANARWEEFKGVCPNEPWKFVIIAFSLTGIPVIHFYTEVCGRRKSSYERQRRR
ncbi:hypothetical protein SH661x_002511 [Planctomicrobium sp. SH661]|uniref:hypothetical protein n=1 Tax=Planctomicrobium sp. SH661 TaxID=3448124 RepID=UPI003F5C7A9C